MAERLKVLHFIYDAPANPWVGGGGAVRIVELYKRLADDVDATVVCGSYPGSRDEVREGVRYVHLGSPAPYAWSRLTYTAAASRWLAREPYDVAVFDFSAYTPLLIPTDRPVCITVHHLTGPSATQRWGRASGSALAAHERWTLRRAKWFTATSLVTREQLREIVTPGSEIRLVQAGVPDDLFTLERREKDYVLYFGRLDWHQKGLDTLLQAVALVVRERPEQLFWIAGRGKDGARVTAEVDRLQLGRNVRLLGGATEDEKRTLLSGAQMLLMPSRFEGFGMVAAEAMAAGVPVVAGDAGSLPEVVAPPDGGVLVPPGDAGALARAVLRLMDDPKDRERLSASARESARRFQWQAVAEQHLTFLRDIHEQSSNVRS